MENLVRMFKNRVSLEPEKTAEWAARKGLPRADYKGLLDSLYDQ